MCNWHFTTDVAGQGMDSFDFKILDTVIDSTLCRWSVVKFKYYIVL